MRTCPRGDSPRPALSRRARPRWPVRRVPNACRYGTKQRLGPDYSPDRCEGHPRTGDGPPHVVLVVRPSIQNGPAPHGEVPRIQVGAPRPATLHSDQFYAEDPGQSVRGRRPRPSGRTDSAVPASSCCSSRAAGSIGAFHRTLTTRPGRRTMWRSGLSPVRPGAPVVAAARPGKLLLGGGVAPGNGPVLRLRSDNGGSNDGSTAS